MTGINTPSILDSGVKGYTFYEYLSIRPTLLLSAVLFDLFREFVLNGRFSDISQSKIKTRFIHTMSEGRLTVLHARPASTSPGPAI